MESQLQLEHEQRGINSGRACVAPKEEAIKRIPENLSRPMGHFCDFSGTDPARMFRHRDVVHDQGIISERLLLKRVQRQQHLSLAR